ncbi:MAG: hypothetical protein EOP48_09515 [Sphingobacteriales bacterium]|nr:MAG: hypothetical protein EOP48_09515 [Sphingobacteriales bacterium]
MVFKLYSRIASDARVNVWHISLYVGLLDIWRLSDFQKQFKVTRKLLMEKSHFKSITTYHKCIDQLIKLGYISYLPNYDPYQGTLIEIKL